METKQLRVLTGWLQGGGAPARWLQRDCRQVTCAVKLRSLGIAASAIASKSGGTERAVPAFAYLWEKCPPS